MCTDACVVVFVYVYVLVCRLLIPDGYSPPAPHPSSPRHRAVLIAPLGTSSDAGALCPSHRQSCGQHIVQPPSEEVCRVGSGTALDE